MKLINLNLYLKSFFFKQFFDFLFNGSFIYLFFAFFDFGNIKNQFFLGICLKIRKKLILSSIVLRCTIYKTVLEVLFFIASPLLFFLFVSPKLRFAKRANCFFLRKKNILITRLSLDKVKV